jgi:anti-anti-sigma regulatory factor
MCIRNLSESIILVILPKEPHMSGELERINEIASDKLNCNVVVDFSKVEMLTSTSICNLMILHKLLSGLGHRLILCSVPFLIKCTFTVTGLEAFFEFADDISVALKSIQYVP